MLKHVQISPLRNRSDSLSLRSSISCASSICGSPEPQSELQRTPSRASSYSSLNEALPQTTIKVFTNCLRIDIEYKTLGIQWDTSSKEVIAQLLRRLKMRHRDPKLFYLSMEVTVRRAGVKTILVLDNEARPAILQACHPKGDSRFCLQLKPGGLIRVHTSALQSSSQYKSLVISQETTCDELLSLLLSCYNSVEPVEQFSLYEVCPGEEYQRKLHPDDIPLRAQNERIQRGETCHFLVRRNPNYPRRRQLLPTLNEMKLSTTTNISNNNNLITTSILTPTLSESITNLNSILTTSQISLYNQQNTKTTPIDNNNSIDILENTKNSIDKFICNDPNTCNTNAICINYNDNNNNNNDINNIVGDFTKIILTNNNHNNNNNTTNNLNNNNNICTKCRNSFKSCEFCNKNSTAMILQTATASSATAITPIQQQKINKLESYNPVYNIREIRTVSHSFSSLGIDKKFLDIELGMIGSTIGAASSATLMPNNTSRPNSVIVMKSTKITNGMKNGKRNSDVNGNSNTCGTITKTTTTTTKTTSNTEEAVNNNPSKGLGHFVYI